MTIIPVLLDARPPYLGQECATVSQLLCPAGAAAVVSELATAVRVLTSHEPLVLPAFTPDAGYLALLRHHCPLIEEVLTHEAMPALLGRLDPSDALLLVSSALVPADGFDLTALLSASRADGAMIRHLLAFDATTVGTKEFVQTGRGGQIRKIQRYFEPVTWPFPVGVIASLVPVACLQMTNSAPTVSLIELRQTLTSRGLPSQDIRFQGECFELNDERGALALNEARVLAKAPRAEGRARHEAGTRAPDVTIHTSARLLGMVAVQAGVVIEANALVIGPSVLGEGARVCEGAVVAQCVVLPGAVVEPKATVRHRVVVPRTSTESRDARPGQRRHGSGGRRLPTMIATENWWPAYLQMKYFVEPIVAAILLLLLAPVLVILGVLVRATSSGPAFYGDLREGRDGRPFRCWKFRTMLENADDMQRKLKAQQQMDGPQFKMDRDPRVTPLGERLRRLNVDELPQLWNVLRGEMSFVGPRPSPFRENQICVPWRHGRLTVRPGITGLWQVCRHDRTLGDFHQWIHYDLLYVRNVSWLVDAKILVYTILTLGGRTPVRLARVLGRAATTADRVSLPTVNIPAVVVPPAPYSTLGRAAPRNRTLRTRGLNAAQL